MRPTYRMSILFKLLKVPFGKCVNRLLFKLLENRCSKNPHIRTPILGIQAYSGRIRFKTYKSPEFIRRFGSLGKRFFGDNSAKGHRIVNSHKTNKWLCLTSKKVA